MNDDQTAPSGASAEDTLDPVEALKAALVAADAKASQNWDSYLRAVAEQDNLRKRAQRDLEQAHKFGLDRVLGELLPVKDSLEMGLGALSDAPEAAPTRTGLELTLRLLTSVLERQGVSEVNPAKGEAFNPEWHEAMAAQETTEAPADSVFMTVQKGYLLNGRLLRPARVLVAKAPTAKAPD